MMIGRIDPDNIPFYMTFDEKEVEEIVVQIISLMQLKWKIKQSQDEDQEW